jgi:hypothetical protein
MMARRAAFTTIIALLLIWSTDVPSSQQSETAGLRVLIAPDHLFEEVRAVIDSAAVSIDIRVHTLDNADLVDAIVSRQRSGVRVRVVLERGLAGPISDQERWAAQQIELAGGAVFVRRPSGAAADPYPLPHARFIIVDDARVLVGSEDLTYQGMPADSKADGTAGRRGFYVLVTSRTITGRLKATFAEALKPSPTYSLLRWNLSHPTYGVAPASFQPDRESGGSGYAVVRNASLRLEGSVPIAVVGCPERCVSEPDALLNLLNRTGAGDTVLVEQHEAAYPNPRLEAYLAAARRGAAVRILLDRVDDDPTDPRGNHAAGRRMNTIASAERLNLEVRLANPTGAGIHSGMVLASLRGARYVHLGSISGSTDPPGAVPHGIGMQLQSDDAYFFLEEIFTNDWGSAEGSSHGITVNGAARSSDNPLAASIVASDAARAIAPPPGSPLARGEHPRILVTRGELPGLRDRLASYYAKELQDFLDLLAGPSLSSQQRRVEAPWGAFNYALVAVLDPEELRRRGFRFDEAMNTPQELCTRSWTYTERLLPDIRAGDGQPHGALATDLADPLHLPVIAAYDWCGSQWTQTQRQLVVDAFISSWAENWRGRDPLTARGVNGMVANNIASADLHDVLGILAFYGDSYPDSATQASLYETFERIWFDRVLVELQYFYGPGTGWHEGSGGYLKEGHLNFGLPFALMSTALGTNYFVDIPFFAQYPAFVAANIKPHGQSSPDGRRYLERWGVISDGISGIGCRGLQLTAGMLARAGDPRAGVARWLHLGEHDERPCDDEMRRRGELWVNAGLYWFLFGDRHVEATPPHGAVPTSLRLGLGEYVFRSDWSPAATQLIAWATEWDMYGHEPRTDGGQFTLHKFGNLIVHAGNGKSGEGVVEDFVGTNLARNVIGIRRETESILKFTPIRTFDPFWIARGLDRIELRGALIADQLGGALDYMAFDATHAWGERADSVQRELVYLRGATNNEFVVVLDRVALRHEEDVPVWKVWTAADTTFSAGNQTSRAHGMWEASGRPVARVVNQRSGLKTEHFESPDTHGTLFVTPVWPERVRMRILGGPEREFQDLDGGTPFGTPPMTDGSREYLGWGRIETWPLDRTSRHVFLHVLQPGDSWTLGSPAPAASLTSADGAWIGTVVEASDKPWMLMWVKDAGRSPVLPLRYRERTGARQAIFNLQPNTSVRVERVGGDVVIGGPAGDEVAVSTGGVLVLDPQP